MRPGLSIPHFMKLVHAALWLSWSSWCRFLDVGSRFTYKSRSFLIASLFAYLN